LAITVLDYLRAYELAKAIAEIVGKGAIKPEGRKDKND
jgi:hypothetical protein